MFEIIGFVGRWLGLALIAMAVFIARGVDLDGYSQIELATLVAALAAALLAASAAFKSE
ncbi:MAG: hypothetical protein AAFS03_02375 [Pseudomonadota bacterium]